MSGKSSKTRPQRLDSPKEKPATPKAGKEIFPQDAGLPRAIKEASGLHRTCLNLGYARTCEHSANHLNCMTAKEWRDSNDDKKGNIRDYADISQLVCLSNLENLNALFINEKLTQAERLAKLNKIAIQQMRLLTEDSRIKKLAPGSK